MGKKLLSAYNSWKLVHKLLAAFVLASIIPILVAQVFALRVNRKNMTDKINELMVSSLTQISEQVNLNLQTYSNLVYRIYKDQQIIENVMELQDDGNIHAAVTYNQIVSQFKLYYNSDSGIRCLSIVCPDGSSVVYDFKTDSSVNTIWGSVQDMRYIQPYVDAVDAPGMVITGTRTYQQQGENQGHFFHVSKRLFDFDHPDRGSIGTVTMTIDQKELDAVCNGSKSMLGSSLNFILDEKRRVISYPDEDYTGIIINPDLEIQEFVKVTGFLRNRNLALNQYTDSSTGWTYCNAYDVDYIFQDISRTQRIQIYVTVFVLLFASILILYIVRTLDTSVQSVVEGMHEVQRGNLDVVVPVQSFREIGSIADNFNDMTVKVKALIQEVGAAKEEQKNAEIRALEAQINPHFLYNTLDSINWMAIEKEEYEISKMIRDLGVILRYSVDKSNQMTTLRQVEDWLKKYIGLQQMRFNDAFSYEIHVEEATRDIKIYKLLLQPFVENAIIHGFREMEYGGLLRIDIQLSEDGSSLIIIIEDNGKGMPPEVAETFNEREKAIQDDGRSIGLHNAFSRMYMYYGDAVSWKVNSIADMGTVITLRLPVRKELTAEDEGHYC